MKVSELMVKDLTSVQEDDTMRMLVETLERSETSSVPVTDEESRLVGIISERDVLAAAVPKYMDSCTVQRSCRTSISWRPASIGLPTIP